MALSSIHLLMCFGEVVQRNVFFFLHPVRVLGLNKWILDQTSSSEDVPKLFRREKRTSFQM